MLQHARKPFNRVFTVGSCEMYCLVPSAAQWHPSDVILGQLQGVSTLTVCALVSKWQHYPLPPPTPHSRFAMCFVCLALFKVALLLVVMGAPHGAYGSAIWVHVRLFIVVFFRNFEWQTRVCLSCMNTTRVTRISRIASYDFILSRLYDFILPCTLRVLVWFHHMIKLFYFSSFTLLALLSAALVSLLHVVSRLEHIKLTFHTKNTLNKGSACAGILSGWFVRSAYITYAWIHSIHKGCFLFFVSRRFASRIHEISDLKKALLLNLRDECTRLRDKKHTEHERNAKR